MTYPVLTPRQACERMIDRDARTILEWYVEHVSYVVDDVTIRRHAGKQYPEGGSGEDTGYDLCGVCFETKRVSDWSY